MRGRFRLQDGRTSWRMAAVVGVLLLAAGGTLLLLRSGPSQEGSPPADAYAEPGAIAPALLTGEAQPEEEPATPSLAGEPDAEPSVSEAEPSPLGGPAEEHVADASPAPGSTTTESGEAEQVDASGINGEAFVRIIGRAYLRGTDEALAGLEVEFEVFAAGATEEVRIHHAATATTDEDGRYELRAPLPSGTSPGDVGLLFLAMDVSRQAGGVYYVGPGDPWGAAAGPDGAPRLLLRAVAEGGTAEVNLPFSRGLPLKGRVLEPDGRTPASNVTVRASTSEGSQRSHGATATTDSGGVFELHLPPNSIGHLRAEGDKGVARTGFRMPGQGAHHDVVMVLAAWGSVEGRVINPRGGPVANVYIQGSTEPATGGRIPISVMSEEDGSFTLERVASGRVELKAIGAAFGPDEEPFFESETVAFDLRPGETEGPVILRMAEGETIPLLVLNRQGNPVEGAQLQVHGGGPSSPRARPAQTGADGRATVVGIAPGGRVDFIGVSHPDYQEAFRTQVSPLDGEQVFRLAPVHDRELIVRWAEDRSPVTHYSYIMLRKGWNDFDIDRMRGNEVVYSEDGRTMIRQLADGEWRVEVVHLTESGDATQVRGVAEFYVSPVDGAPEAVEVLLTDERRIAGRVTLAESGEPVAGALVDIVPPAQHDPVYFFARPAAADRHLEPARTDTAGHFEIAGLTAGTHTLTVVHGDHRTQYPLDVRVPAEEDPDFVEIQLHRGGVIHGVVIDAGGDPVEGARIGHRAPNPNYTAWDGSEQETDAEGRYRLTGLAGGPHMVSLAPTRPGLEVDYREVDLDFGEELRVDFNFHDRIRVHGEVRLADGLEADLDLGTLLMFNPGGEGSAAQYHLPTGSREYEVRLRPGSYTVSAYLGGQDLTGEGQHLTVAESPAEQRHDITLDFAEADVVLVFPSEGDFSPGLVMIAPEDRHRRYGFIRVRMEQEARRTVHLMGGDYTATFTSQDGNWRGETGTVPIGAGEENAFVMDVKRVQRNVPIGQWDPSSITLQPTPHLFDVTPHIQSSGEITLLMEYERGRNAAVTLWAKLYENGEEIAARHHEGWSGFEKWNNSYRLRLDGYDPTAVYHVEAGLRGDGGVDSFGTIYLNMN